MSRPPLPTLVTPPPLPADETDYAQRDFRNLVATAVLLFLAVMITWTASAFYENEKNMRCYESGRKDCLALPVAPQGMRATSH